MRVGFDLLALEDDRAAASLRRYALNLIAQLVERDSIQVVIFGSFHALDAFRTVAPGATFVPTPDVSGLKRVVLQQALIPRLARSYRLDILHGMAHVLPVFPSRPQMPLVVTIHDFRYLHQPRSFSMAQRLFRMLTYARSARAADAVLAISMSTRDEALQRYGLRDDKVFVAYMGIGPEFREIGATEKIATPVLVAEAPYVLAAANHRHKRPDLAISAMAMLREKGISLNLICFGAPAPFAEELRGLASRLKVSDRVNVLGFVSDTDLPLLFARATVFLFPSEFEGFGMPPLEAMACGVPVISSKRGALSEVLGTAPYWLSSVDAPAIVAALERVLGDQQLQSALRSQGLNKAREFSWRRTADATLAAYRAAIGLSSSI